MRWPKDRGPFRNRSDYFAAVTEWVPVLPPFAEPVLGLAEGKTRGLQQQTGMTRGAEADPLVEIERNRNAPAKSYLPVTRRVHSGKKKQGTKPCKINASDPRSGLPAAAHYRARIASSQDFDRVGERKFSPFPRLSENLRPIPNGLSRKILP
jgi:hypothetical protein